MQPAISSILILFFSFSSLLVSADPDRESFKNRERIIAAQILIMEGKDEEGISRELDSIKSAGFNTIFIRVFQNNHDRYHRITGIKDEDKYLHPSGVYFATANAPVIHDILTPLSHLCREKGLKLFAWMTTRQMDWLENDNLRDRAFNDQAGELITSRKYDLFNPLFLDYQQKILKDLASQEIDGIILQDDFVILTREGFTEAGIQQFNLLTSMEISPSHIKAPGFFPKVYGSDVQDRSKLFYQWCVFKAGYLAKLGEDLVTICKEVNPKLKMGINLYYDSAVSPEKGLQWLGQDQELVLNSSFDYILTMSYHRQIASELSLSVREAIEIIVNFNENLLKKVNDRLILKIQSVDWSTGLELPAAEFDELTKSLPKGYYNFAVVPVRSGGDLMKKIIDEIILKGSEVNRNEQ